MQFTKFLPNQGGRTKCLSGFVQRRSTMHFLMRVSVFYVALISGSIQLSLASSGVGQKLDETYVTVELNHESLQNLFEKIEKQTNLLFTFPEGVKSYNALTLAGGRRSVKETLDMVLKDTPVTYKQINGNLVAVFVGGGRKMSSEVKTVESNKSVIVLAVIAGTVKDALSQEPLAGVNVIVKGTTKGTTTDVKGTFGIDAVDSDVLVFTFIGYKTFEAQVNGQSLIDVKMEADVRELGEVIVNAGYWTVKKEEQTGSIVKVTSKDIQKQPISNPLAALQGRVSGLEVMQTSGVPGGNFKVRIRGQNSIANGNDPLYIIDGVPYISSSLAFGATSGEIFADGRGSSPLNNINPADIESIEVLKDADATAIYGSRGANGVILITTRKGQVGKTKVDFSFYTGVGKVTSKMDLLNTSQYLEMRKEAYANDEIDYTNSSVNAPDLKTWDTTRYTDWQKELIGGSSQYRDAQFSISGGEKYTQFSVGTGYHGETTVFPGDNKDQRVSIHASLSNTSPNQKLKTNFIINYSVNNTNLIRKDLTYLALTLSPIAPSLYKDGDLNWGPTAWNGTDVNMNPLSYTKQEFEARTNTLIGNAVIGYSLLPNLEIKTNVGFTNTVMKAVTVTPISSLDPALSDYFENSSAFSNRNIQSWIVEPQINWKPKTAEGQFELLAGATFLEQKNDGYAQYANGFPSEALMKNINAASTIIKSTSEYTQYRYNKFFGRINYNWKGKYIINVTGSRDGSSRFGPGKQFANFGAIGAAWLFFKEGFIQNPFSFVSFGKIRASYGVTGNDQIGDYQYLDTYSPAGSGSYQGNVGLSPQRLFNPQFAWETNKKFEIGLDLGFLNDKIFASINYFRNRSSNQLVGYPLPPTTGFTFIQSNFPATVQNTGVEFELNTVNIQRGEFSWTTSLNLTFPRNKLIEFPDIEESPQYATTLVVGEPINSIYKLYHYTGVNKATGIYEFEDVNGDGVYDSDDRQVVKFAGQDFYGGITNSFQYKGFQFEFLFQFVKQTGVSYLFYTSPSAPGRQFNVPVDVMNRWRQDGDNSDIQRFSTLSNYQAAYSTFLGSDRAITDASFIRLKNLSLSYSLSKTWIGKLHMENCRFFLQCQNLLTITNYSGLDPETQNSVLPPLRVITGGINVTF